MRILGFVIEHYVKRKSSVRAMHAHGDISLSTPGLCFNVKTVFPDVGIPMIKIRRSWGRLVFIMGIVFTTSTSVRWRLCIVTTTERAILTLSEH